MARYLAHVTLDGTLRPVDPERLKRLAGHDVWFSVYENPSHGIRSNDQNRYYWGVVIRAICEETGNDPASAHYGLKAEAVRVGVLEPEYITVGDQLLPAEPTTVVDSEAFSRYVEWVIDFARTKLGVHVEEAS